MKLLAIVGSHRKNGNSYTLAKEAMKSAKADCEIIQLAEQKIEFCNMCGKCETQDCILKDDFNKILKKMKEADGIIFSFPKYFSLSSKFLCFLERLLMIHQFREYHGYRRTGIEPDSRFVPLFTGKPFCLFVVSGSGRAEEPLRLVADQLGGEGMKLLLTESWPFIGVLVKGEDRRDAPKDKKGIEECKKLTNKLIASVKRSKHRAVSK